MARYTCQRCEAALNTLDAPHLCKDVEARLREAERRALTPCRQPGSMNGWLARLEATVGPARPPKGGIDWVVDGHGRLLDPGKDALDVPAQRMLASRSAS